MSNKQEPPKAKSGEKYDGVYTTSFGARVAVPRSEVAFYAVILNLRRNRVITDMAYRTAEASLFFNNYQLVA